MIRLIKVELTRLRWRRAVVGLLVGCVVLPVMVLAGTAWDTRPLSADDLAQAERQAAAEAEQPWVQQEIRRCERRPERYLGPGATAEECVAQITPRAENYLYRPELVVSAMRTEQGVAVVAIVAALLLIAGTTFVGHDWNTGSVSNQLLFDPRRVRVWLAKAAAILLTGAVVSAGVLALFWGATALLAAQRDISTSSATWEAIAGTSARGVALAALAGLLGYALTMLFRSTVATLAVAFAAAAGGSLLLASLLGERAMAWMPTSRFAAVLLDGYEYHQWTPTCEAAMVESQGQVTDPCMALVTLGEGVTYWATILVLAAGLSVLAFRRRDLP